MLLHGEDFSVTPRLIHPQSLQTLHSDLVWVLHHVKHQSTLHHVKSPPPGGQATPPMSLTWASTAGVVASGRAVHASGGL
jgi:hypothetical protein